MFLLFEEVTDSLGTEKFVRGVVSTSKLAADWLTEKRPPTDDAYRWVRSFKVDEE